MNKSNNVPLIILAFLLVLIFLVFLTMNFFSNSSTNLEENETVSQDPEPVLMIPTTQDSLDNFGNFCEDEGGIWLSEHRECEGIDADSCAEAETFFPKREGLIFFDQCASACRHDAEAEMCITQCVPLCYIQ